MGTIFKNYKLRSEKDFVATESGTDAILVTRTF
jgi:hypothetical protein